MIHPHEGPRPAVAGHAASPVDARPNGPPWRSRSACSSGSLLSSACTRILGIAFAFLLNYNRVAVLLGVYSSLPWVISARTTPHRMFVGAPLTGHRDSRGLSAAGRRFVRAVSLSGDFWHELAHILRPFLVPASRVGSLLGAVVLSAVAYPLALAFLTSRRRLKHLIHSSD
mgnify:CR=1 FL=1